MRSKLFSKRDLTSSDAFVKDIGKLLGLSEEALKRLAPHACHAMVAPTEIEESKVRDQASEELVVPRRDLDQAIDVSGFFLKQFMPSGDAETDAPGDIVADMEQVFQAPPEKREVLIQYLAHLKDWSESRGHRLLERRRSTRVAAPFVRGISAGVDFRAVFDRHFHSGDDIDAYSPTCLGTVPLGLVEIRLTGGARDESVYFQVDKRSLRLLVEHLVALEKEMQVAEGSLNLKEVAQND